MSFASLTEGHLIQRWQEELKGGSAWGMPTIRPERETNRILAEFHSAQYTSIRFNRGHMRTNALDYIDYITRGDVYDWRYVPQEQKDHAVKVLGRLARILDEDLPKEKTDAP